MPLLRKTGIRAPWLPAPLQPSADPLRQVIAIVALVPALLLGGNTQPVGRPAPPEDVGRAARTVLVQRGDAPLPGATAWLPRPVGDEALTRPATVQGPGVPLPCASAWLPPPSRTSDLLWPARALVVAQVPPAPPPSAISWLPRILGDESITQPAVVRVPSAPLPGASVWAPAPAREPVLAWAARPLTIAQSPFTPIPGAAALPLGIVHDGDRLPLGIVGVSVTAPVPTALVWAHAPLHAPNTDPLRAPILIPQPWAPQSSALVQSVGAVRDAPTDRLAPVSSVSSPSSPIAATVTLLTAPRDEVAPEPEHLAFVQVVSGGQSQYAALFVPIGRAVMDTPDRLAPTYVVGAPAPVLGGCTISLPALRDEAIVAPSERLARTQVVGRWGMTQAGVTLFMGRPAADTPERLPGAITVVASAPPPSSALALSIGIVRDEDRTAGGVLVTLPTAPPYGPTLVLVGPARGVSPDRLAITQVIGAAPAPYGATAAVLYAPREAVAAPPPDRAWAAVIIVPARPPQSALTQFVGRIVPPPSGRVFPALVVCPVVYPPSAIVVQWGGVRYGAPYIPEDHTVALPVMSRSIALPIALRSVVLPDGERGIALPDDARAVVLPDKERTLPL